MLMRPLGATVLVIAVTAGGCVAASSPSRVVTPAGPQAQGRGGPIDDELKAAGAELETMAWSAERPLRLDDFRAPVPANAVEGARTAYVLRYAIWCRGGVFRFEVTAAFLPGHSWMSPRAFTDAPEGRRILTHEQTHFSQTEVYARRMRRFFQDQLYYPCGQTETQLNALAERFVTDEAEAQARYDEETSFGRIPERQRAWDQHVAEALAALEKYAVRP